MKNKLIKRAYDSVRPTPEAKARMLANILTAAAQEPLPAPHAVRTRPHPLRYAASAAAALVLVAAAAIGLSTLNARAPIPLSPTPSESEPTQTVQASIASLSDYVNLPIYQAASNLDSAAICRKYALLPQGNSTNYTTKQSFFTAAGIRTVFRDPAAEYLFYYGNLYPDGSFLIEAQTQLPGLWPVEYEYLRTRKDTFCAELPLIDTNEIAVYDQWVYDVGGVSVLLASRPDDALMIADLGDRLVTIRILNPAVDENAFGELQMDKATLEAIAGTFDFSCPPGVPDTERVTSVEEYMIQRMYQAQLEWEAFLKNEQANKYDESEFDFSNSRWSETQAALCKKYGLCPPCEHDSHADIQSLFHAAGVGTLFSSEDVTRTFYNGYTGTDGSLYFEASVRLQGENPAWIFPTEYSFVCAPKTTFDSKLPLVDGIGEYRQWQLGSGEDALVLVLGTERALIIADLGERIAVVNIENVRCGDLIYGEVQMGLDGLAAIAGTFDFSQLAK